MFAMGKMSISFFFFFFHNVAAVQANKSDFVRVLFNQFDLKIKYDS